MLLDNSDNLNISDADPLDPALEATTLPKFDMNLYKSSLSETHVKWLIKCYKIPEELTSQSCTRADRQDELPKRRHPIGLKGKVFTMAEFLRLLNFRGCKVAASTLLPPGIARVTYLTPLLIGWRIFHQRWGDMEVAEMLCRKVLAKKEKKKKKSEVKLQLNQ
ncbi:hypothetical protein Tco_0429007 [Tanacetum coccineum]